MDKIFIQIINMSLTASYVIAFVLLLRLLLKRAPKIFSYALWAVVLFRLLCPFSFESMLSLIPTQMQTHPAFANYSFLEQEVSFGSAAGAALEAVADAANGGLGLITVYLEPVVEGETNVTFAVHSEVWILFGQYIWAFGIAALLIYSIVSLLRLRSKLVSSVKWRDNIYFADYIPSPFVLGIIRPKIYLPSTLGEDEREHIILHEQTHIRRFDHIWKIVAFFALVLHWFNPLVWLAYTLFIRDMEMSCDESVMRHMEADIRGKYSASLLSLATGRRIITGTPLAFGEDNTKGRIKNVMNYKKPTLWIVIVAAIAVVAVGVALIANPYSQNSNETGDSHVSINYSDVMLEISESFKLAVSGAAGTPTYAVSDSAVADVIQDGTVTALSDGTTTVTVIVDGEILECIVRVLANAPVSDSGQVSAATDNTPSDAVSSDLYSDAVPFPPEEIHNLVSASFIVNGITLTTTENADLRWIEINFGKYGEEQGGNSACTEGSQSPLYLTRSDGTVGILYPALDGCKVFRAGGVDYEYGPGNNAEFYYIWGTYDYNLLLQGPEHQFSTRTSFDGSILAAKVIDYYALQGKTFDDKYSFFSGGLISPSYDDVFFNPLWAEDVRYELYLFYIYFAGENPQGTGPVRRMAFTRELGGEWEMIYEGVF